jgi:hypothetical protein
MPVAAPGDGVNGCPPPNTLPDATMSLLQRILVALANLVFALVFGRALGA